MAKWQDYTAKIDHILGAMSPEDRAAVEGYSTKHDATFAAKEIEAAIAAMKKYGYSDQQARTLVETARAVRKRGGENVGEGFDENAVFGQEPMNTSVDPDQSARDAITAKLQAFADSMLAGIPDNDPTAQYIRRASVNAAQSYGGRAGVNARSTLGAGFSAGLTQRGLEKYDFDRKQLGLQAQGMVSNRDLGLGQLEQGYMDRVNALAESEFAHKQNQSQAMMGAVGGALGTVAGGYFGGTQGAALGGQAGSSFGAGLGGLAAGGTGPSYQTSRYGNTTRSGGLGGAGKPRGTNPYTGY